MTTFTIELDDNLTKQLEERAAQQKIAPEVWLRQHLSEVISSAQKSENDMTNAVDYVLDKNAELYRRLA